MFSSSTVEGLPPSFGLLLRPDHVWCAKHTDVNPYLEVRFGTITFLNALAMQGDVSGNNDVNEFTLHVRVSASGKFEPKMVSKVEVGWYLSVACRWL